SAHTAVAGLDLEHLQPLLCVAVGFDIGSGARVILVRGEDENLAERASILALYGPIELHLGDGDQLSLRHPAVAPSIDPEIDVRPVYHTQRNRHAGRITRGELLHPDGEYADSETRLTDCGAVRWQIERGAADQCRELTWFVVGGRHAFRSLVDECAVLYLEATGDTEGLGATAPRMFVGDRWIVRDYRRNPLNRKVLFAQEVG